MSIGVKILCAAGFFVFGTLAAYINLLISRRSLNADTVAGVMGNNMARMLVDIAALGITFLVCRHFELPLAICLIAVAIGLTVCGMLMLSNLAKSIEKKDGGE